MKARKSGITRGMTAELDPATIWEEKGANYLAPWDEVKDRLAACLIEENRQLWDKYTPYKTAWHLARQSGLKAWSLHEAESRLRGHRRRSYSFDQWQEMHLLDSIGILGEQEFTDPHWQDFAEAMRTQGGLTAMRRFVDKTERQPWKPDPIQRTFCCWWDRYRIPLEFWTYPATVTLFERELRNHLKLIPSEDRLRQWVRRLKLKKAGRPIVAKWDSSGPKIDKGSARLHGLPTG
jgi:hypothetical protein